MTQALQTKVVRILVALSILALLAGPVATAPAFADCDTVTGTCTG